MGALFKTTAEREQERVDKRHALMEAAARLFNERGFHDTSLTDIAASLDASKPVLYHYLGNKDRVLLECLRHASELVWEAYDGGPEDRAASASLVIGVERHLIITMNEFGRCLALTNETDLSEPSMLEFRQMKRRTHDVVRRLVAADAGSNGARNAHVAHLVLGAVDGTASWLAADEAGLVRHLAHMICAMAGQDPSS